MGSYVDLEGEIRKAGDVLLSFFKENEKNTSLKIMQKEDDSPVSEADIASNEILLDAIHSIFPGDAVYSEETPIEEGVFSHDRVWIIDPLDGTRSFIHGKKDFSILIGLSVNHVMQYGVMYFPALGLFCKAEKGSGAFVNDAALAVVDKPGFSADSVYVRNTEIRDESYSLTAKMDSGYAFYQLAQGEIEGLVIKLTHHREWDYAAPSLIVEEAGGIVTCEKGKAIAYASSENAIDAVVASHSARHQGLIDLIS